MKRILKKSLIVLVIIVTLFNFIFFEPVSYAEDTVGQVLIGLLGTFIGIFSWIPRLFAMAAAWAADALTSGVAYMDGATAGNSGVVRITPYEILFNKIQLLDVNFFDFSVPQDSATYKIRTAVASWFYVMRLIAVSILLVILIYMGIRMAITTVAEDKARYKKMLVDWVTSIALVFFLQYIIIFTVAINTALVKALDASDLGQQIRDSILRIAGIALGFTIESFACTVVYCMIVYQTLGLVISYINRMIKIAFLIIISPLISITYSIDKIGDGKSQALDAWLKEFIYTILMQPFHCIIYMIFVNTAFELLVAPENPGWMHDVSSAVLAILSIKFTRDAEKIVRKIFNFKDDNSGTSLIAGTGAALLALNYAKGIGKTARKGINAVKESRIGQNLAHDASKLRAGATAAFLMKDEKEQGADFGQRVAIAEQRSKEKKEEKQAKKDQKYMMKHGGTDADKKIQQRAEQIAKANPGLKKAQAERMALAEAANKKREKKKKKGVMQKIRNFKGFVGSLETTKFVKNTVIPAGLGFAVASMAFGGESDLFTSVAMGAAMNNSAAEFMKNSNSTLAEQITNNIVAAGATDGQDAKDKVTDIRNKGDRGEYDQEKFRAMIEEISNLLKNAGAEDISGRIISTINTQMKLDPNINIDKLLAETSGIKEVVGSLKANNKGAYDQLRDKTKGYHTKRAESNVYDLLKNGENYGVSTDTLARGVEEKFDYVHSYYQAKNENTQNAETIEDAEASAHETSERNRRGESSSGTDTTPASEHPEDEPPREEADGSGSEEENKAATEEAARRVATEFDSKLKELENSIRGGQKEVEVIIESMRSMISEDKNNIEKVETMIKNLQKDLERQSDAGEERTGIIRQRSNDVLESLKKFKQELNGNNN